MARHARADDDVVVPPLRLVDADPYDYDLEPLDTAFSPEVRAVLDAVAVLHSALISWAAASSAPGWSTGGAEGRHRR